MREKLKKRSRAASGSNKQANNVRGFGPAFARCSLRSSSNFIEARKLLTMPFLLWERLGLAGAGRALVGLEAMRAAQRP